MADYVKYLLTRLARRLKDSPDASRNQLADGALLSGFREALEDRATALKAADNLAEYVECLFREHPDLSTPEQYLRAPLREYRALRPATTLKKSSNA